MSDTPRVTRRTVLSGLATAGIGSLAGCSLFGREPDGETTSVEPDRAETLATRFAPTLYFDSAEPWFPTDPRPYTSERDGETIVDGFDALDGYHERADGADEPPDPTVFYHVVEYEESPLAVVQFWLYSAFDQFTTNFHWHDWEVLHVFVDTETDDPQLYVASSHSRSVPNNEFLDPDPETVPRILAELGSHSSALSLNDVPERFQRLSIEDLVADITNSSIEGLEVLAELPLAYGLPRDEGARLPYVVPEYEGVPVYDHERLPNVTRESLVDEELTVRSFESLSSPPTNLPERATGVVFHHEGREDVDGEEAASATVGYELVASSEIEGITDFTGPQLSFEFAVPQFAEDAIAGHISTTGAPWGQPRYQNPAADITDPNHRTALADRYDAIGGATPTNTVIARVTEAVSSDDAPEDSGLTTQESTVESVALIESDPVAVPTFRGVVALRDVPDGEHRLTVNAPGQAPYSERLSVGGDSGSSGSTTTAASSTAETETATAAEPQSTTDEPAPEAADADARLTVAGNNGQIPLVARENARKLEVDADGTDADLTRLAIEDDFGGRLYDNAINGPAAVYVHQGGAYTTEVRDTDGAIGAFRVNPDPTDGDDSSGGSQTGAGAEPTSLGPPIRIDRPDTGKASLSSFLAAIATETSDDVATFAADTDDSDDTDSTTSSTTTDTKSGSGNAVRGLSRALEAVATAAGRAAENARKGDRERANRQLEAVSTGLARVSERLIEASGDLPDPVSTATRRRIDQARRRTAQAQRSEKL